MASTDKQTFDVTRLEGCVVDKYEIQSVLGKGGMAIVYKAIHQEFESPVAIKFLLPEYARQTTTRRRFRDEARLQFKLRHPNLVRVVHSFEEGNAVGVVMDYVEGEDLGTLLKKNGKPFTFAEIQEIFLPVLDAVGYAHAHQVIHRDLKPSNVLVETRGGRHIPYVMDFGIAKSLEQGGGQTKIGSFLGSPQYASPEQVVGEKTIDHRADIYSLGCTLYEILAMGPPFRWKESVQHILRAHLTETPPSLEAIYPTLDPLLKKALAKDPGQRFASCEAFAKELSLFLTTAPEPRYATLETSAFVEPTNDPLLSEGPIRLPTSSEDLGDLEDFGKTGALEESPSTDPEGSLLFAEGTPSLPTAAFEETGILEDGGDPGFLETFGDEDEKNPAKTAPFGIRIDQSPARTAPWRLPAPPSAIPAAIPAPPALSRAAAAPALSRAAAAPAISTVPAAPAKADASLKPTSSATMAFEETLVLEERSPLSKVPSSPRSLAFFLGIAALLLFLAAGGWGLSCYLQSPDTSEETKAKPQESEWLPANLRTPLLSNPGLPADALPPQPLLPQKTSDIPKPQGKPREASPQEKRSLTPADAGERREVQQNQPRPSQKELSPPKRRIFEIEDAPL